MIPGVNKPSLFKPGAETINVALRLAPHYDSEKIWHEDGHLTVIAKCTLKHIPTDLTIATGEGLCSTKEDRYAYRTAKRVCPNCGTEAIIKGKAEYGGGWVCSEEGRRLGSNFNDDDERHHRVRPRARCRTPDSPTSTTPSSRWRTSAR